jgi:hypothetical protein
MNARTQQLLDAILDLPAPDRALLADELEASLEKGAVAPEAAASAWADEAERRLREVEAEVEVVGVIAASEVDRQLRDKFGLGR